MNIRIALSVRSAQLTGKKPPAPAAEVVFEVAVANQGHQAERVSSHDLNYAILGSDGQPLKAGFPGLPAGWADAMDLEPGDEVTYGCRAFIEHTPTGPCRLRCTGYETTAEAAVSF